MLRYLEQQSFKFGKNKNNKTYNLSNFNTRCDRVDFVFQRAGLSNHIEVAKRLRNHEFHFGGGFGSSGNSISPVILKEASVASLGANNNSSTIGEGNGNSNSYGGSTVSKTNVIPFSSSSSTSLLVGNNTDIL